MEPVKYSVIIPMFNEQEVIAESYRRLTAVMSGMNETYELLFVNDGSRDGTMGVMRDIAEADEHVRILNFSRNFGHQAAVTAGMAHVRGEATIIIDADLQDPPECIPGMAEKWKEGYDVVYGKRLRRDGESAFKLLTAKWYYRFINKLTNNMIPTDTGDFRLIDRKVVDTMNALPEKNRFLRGLGSWVGFRQTAYEYKRDERWAGETKYPLKKMLKLAGDGIVGFSSAPLKWALGLGVGLLGLGLIWLLTLIVLAICGVGFGGWMIVLAGGCVLTALILLALGVMGEYIARIYDEAKDRPVYIIDSIIEKDERA